MSTAKGLSLINHQFFGKITGLSLGTCVLVLTLPCNFEPGYLGYSLYNEVTELEVITKLLKVS